MLTDILMTMDELLSVWIFLSLECKREKFEQTSYNWMVSSEMFREAEWKKKIATTI